MTRAEYWKEMLEEALENYLTDDTGILESAKRYALEDGKRLRGMLTLAWCEYYGGCVEDALAFAVAVELVHAASLAHDDLPCMDNADERRGKPSLHRQFGESIAVLVGDALMADALLTAAGDSCPRRGARILADAATRMADAQAEELEGVLNIESIYDGKTAALIAAACELGALAANRARNFSTDRAWSFGRELGIAYQFADDLADGDGIAVTPEGRELAQASLNSALEQDACKVYGNDEVSEWLRSLPEMVRRMAKERQHEEQKSE